MKNDLKRCYLPRGLSSTKWFMRKNKSLYKYHIFLIHSLVVRYLECFHSLAVVNSAAITKKNEILSFTSKWMELENIILSEVSQAQKAKNCMFSSYVDYRPEANTVIILDMDHTKGRPHMRGIVQGKETKNLNVVDVLTV
jgi:hypothetical protein